MRQLSFIILILTLFSCKAPNYTVVGICKEEYIPQNGEIHMSVYSSSFVNPDATYTTTIQPDGSFTFKGYTECPMIGEIYTFDDEDREWMHFLCLCIVEEGTVVLDCENFQTTRTILDIKSSGTPLNDKIVEYDNNLSKIELNELPPFPSMIKYTDDFIIENFDNIAGVLIALRSRIRFEMYEKLPQQILSHPIVKEQIQLLHGDEDDEVILIESSEEDDTEDYIFVPEMGASYPAVEKSDVE